MIIRKRHLLENAGKKIIQCHQISKYFKTNNCSIFFVLTELA